MYKLQIFVALLDLYLMKITLSTWQIEKYNVFIKTDPGKFSEIKSFFRDAK